MARARSQRRFVRRGLSCVAASIGLAAGCEAYQRADPAEESPTSVDAAVDGPTAIAESGATDGHDGLDASTEDAGSDANVSPCLGKVNGTVIGVTSANTCCDGKLTDLHTDDHCGGCNIRCGFNGKTHCTKAPTGVWACNECSTNDVCRNNGYGPSSTCYELGTGGGSSGPNAYCQCQCPTLEPGATGTCNSQCSDGMTCHDLGTGGNPNPCKYD